MVKKKYQLDIWYLIGIQQGKLAACTQGDPSVLFFFTPDWNKDSSILGVKKEA